MNTVSRQALTPEVIERNDYLKSILSEKEGKESEFDELSKIYEELYDLHNKYNFFDYVFEENGLKGIKDIKGNVRVPALYSDFSETYDYNKLREYPVCAFDSHGKCGLVSADGTGMPLTSFVYDMINFDILCGFFRAVKNGKNGLLSYKGSEIVPCEMDTIYGMSNCFMAVEKDGRLGFVTSYGFYVSPEYSELEEDDGFIKVLRNGEWGYIDVNGAFVSEEESENDDVCLLYLGLD